MSDASDEEVAPKEKETTAIDTTKPADSVDKIEEAEEEEVDFDAAEHEEVEPKLEEKKEEQKSSEDNAGSKSVKSPKKRTVEFTQTGSLHIKGFKRPLQEKAVKERMESFGEVKHFWMNSTKSACLVTWMNIDDSRTARRKLQDSFFPVDMKPPLAGKLKCERTDEKSVIFAQNNKKRKPRKNRLFAKALKESTDSIKASRKRKRKGDTSQAVKKKTKRALDLATELLLNYCKRTEAKPRIFWKPLTETEIRAKERQKRLEEERERRKRQDHQALLRSRNYRGDRRSRSRRRSPPRRRRSPRRSRDRYRRSPRRSPRRDYRNRRGDRRY